MSYFPSFQKEKPLFITYLITKHMKKTLLTLLGATCFLSSFAQISQATLWNFNFMVDAMPHTKQTWMASGFTLYEVDIVYNAKGKPTSFTTSTPAPITDQIDQYKCTSTVTGNSLVGIAQKQEAGETPWLDWERTTFYSDGTNDTMVLQEGYNTTTSAWENNQRTTWVYSGANVSELTGYYWQGGAWKHSQTNQFIYNGGKFDSAYTFVLNTTTGNLEKDGYRKYFYSTQLDSVLEYSLENGVMVFANRIVVNSSVNGKTASFTSYNWDNNAWEESLKIMYGAGGATGLSHVNQNAEIKLYPNPATTELTIQTPTASTETAVTILDLQGKVVLSQTIQSLQSQIDLTTLNQGVYFVRLQSAGSTSTQKLIKY